MTTLVTGGAGFIGSHLTESLLGTGEDVIVLDDLSTGSEQNLAAVLDHPSFGFVKGSILDAALVDELVSQAGTVYHLAAAVGTFTILDKTLESLRTNLHGTENVVDSALRHGARVLIASTSEVYGKNTKIGLREDDDRHIGSPLKNRWSYAEAKAIDETLAYLYAVEHDLQTVIVRLFNTVGPRQTGRYGMVIPNFVSQAIAGDPITVFGDGTQTRSFTYVGDVVEALITLVQTPRAVGEVFNIGNAEEISILALAEKVKALTGSTSPVTFISYEDAYEAGFEDMPRRVPDLGKIAAAIGYHPRVGLDEILTRVIAHMRTTPDLAGTRAPLRIS